jgi:hypothetical protein
MMIRKHPVKSKARKNAMNLRKLTDIELPPEVRAILHSELELMVRKLSTFAKCDAEIVVEEIRRWYQTNSRWPTNPSESDKKRSFVYHGRTCFNCGQPISSLTDAMFHHQKRGIRGLHRPQNMVPCHRKGKCYESVQSK